MLGIIGKDVRNKWVKETMHNKSCDTPIRSRLLNRKYYTVNKQFIVYFAPDVNISQEMTMRWKTVNLLYAKKS
jgi:predicted transglutaminase-like protease